MYIKLLKYFCSWFYANSFLFIVTFKMLDGESKNILLESIDCKRSVFINFFLSLIFLFMTNSCALSSLQ